MKAFAKKKRLTGIEEINQDLTPNPNYKNLNQELLKKLNAKDILIIPDVSTLGSSFSIVIDVITKLLKKNVEVRTAREPLTLHPKELNSQTFLDALQFSKSIEQFIVTQRASRGLIKRKASGNPLGRPKGRKSRTTKLSGKEDRVVALLTDGFGYSGIGRALKVNRLTVRAFIKSHRLKPGKS